MRVQEGRSTIDGKLDEPAWQRAPAYTSFIQRDPDEGKKATEGTHVHVLYDDDSIYIGAELKDSQPKAIKALLGRRDADLSSDSFTVYLDPYNDKRTGFYFGISAGGTLTDGTLFNDDWNSSSWDGIWEGKARRDDNGWTVEYRIPLSQLRFKQEDDARWGINFRRQITRTNEQAYAALRPKKESGFVSRFLPLVGLTGSSAETALPRHALHHGQDPHLRGPRRRSILRRPALSGGVRRRLQVRHRFQSHTRRHHESRLRPGRGRSRGGESLGRRVVLQREAAVLHRGLRHLRVRVGRGVEQHELQLLESQHLLLTSHRPCATGVARVRRLLAGPRWSADQRGGEAHRPGRRRLEHGDPARDDRAGGGRPDDRRPIWKLRGRAKGHLQRGSRTARLRRRATGPWFHRHARQSRSRGHAASRTSSTGAPPRLASTAGPRWAAAKATSESGL